MLVTVIRGTPIEVNASEPEVQQVLFDPEKPPSNIDFDEAAKTDWQYSNSTDFSYEFDRKEQFGDRWVVKLRPVSVRVNLALKIVEFLPKGAPETLLAHEQGHVDICKRIYGRAADGAREAARSAIGRSFGGEGATLDEACADAISDATDKIDEIYRLNTVVYTNDVSEIYDYLQLAPDALPKRSVDEAFETYAKGKPARLNKR